MSVSFQSGHERFCGVIYMKPIQERLFEPRIPKSELFNSEWRKHCHIKPCGIPSVDEFVQAHYLQTRPAIVLLCLMMFHDTEPVGCVIYSAPPIQTEVRYGGKTWELSRLYLLDAVPKNGETWLISKSVRYIARNHREVSCLVSYADPSAGHTGTIYKAANWKQDGRTDDDRKTPKFDLVDANSGKKYSRASHVPSWAATTRLPRVSKFRFFYQLH